MQRREFIKSVIALGGGLAAGPAFSQQAPPDGEVKRVLVMFKCHFDAGFIDTQAAVVHRYFASIFPRRWISPSQLRQSGAQRYVWTTGSWLLYEYLEQATPEQRTRMEKAIAMGDIAWHALPFSWQTEMLDESMISGSIGVVENAGPALWPHDDRRQDDRRAWPHPRLDRPTCRSRREVSGYWRESMPAPSRRSRRCFSGRLRMDRRWWSCITMATAASPVCRDPISPSPWWCAMTTAVRTTSRRFRRSTRR